MECEVYEQPVEKNYVKGMDSDIIAIQEIWQKEDDIIANFETIDIIERKEQRGGGTAIIVKDFPEYRIKERYNINKDCNLLKISFLNNYIWMINVYLNKGQISKIQKLFGKIQKYIPYCEMSQLIIIGDFNVDITKKEDERVILLNKLCKQMGLRIQNPGQATRKESTIDYMICGKSVKVNASHTLPSLDDHKAVRWTIEIDFPERVKQLKIPSRSMAEKITKKILSNEEVTMSAIFLEQLHLYRKDNRKGLLKLVPRKARENKLLEQLIKAEEGSNIDEIVNDYWKNVWEETERQRWSNESRIAYDNLKRILKYHLFEGGGDIINKIQSEDGEIITNDKELNDQLARTIEELQQDEKWEYLNRTDFPKLPRLSREELKNIMESLSKNKAITLDGLSDCMFKEENIDRAADIFQDLWSIDLNEISGIQRSFTSRLIPLNKVAPNIPTRKQMRPIIVSSPLQKLLEARFLSKLTQYMKKRLVRSQTGFVPGMGIQVNLLRAVGMIRKTTDMNRNVYGLFVDFANAYNNVPHQLLFKKLREKKCLEEEEIRYLEALYTRYRIRVGDKFIRYNKGVAQGSILSPALFNIFIEDLAEKLEKEGELNFQDILLYADDILLLCKTEMQLKKCINIIETWCSENGMELNKKKSGVLIFAPRRAMDIPNMKRVKKGRNNGDWIPARESINGIPIVSKYKYLGTCLDNKLTMKTQLDSIRRKANFLFVRLYPFLVTASAEGRRDMWLTMVSPLFNSILITMYAEESISHDRDVMRLRRYTFKRFMLIPKSTNSNLVDEMIGTELYDVMRQVTINAAEKWNCRVNYEEVKEKKVPLKLNMLRGIPKEWCNIIKQQCSLCQICRNSTRNEEHMSKVHGVEIYPYWKVWEEIKQYYLWKKKEHEAKKTIKKLPRSIFYKFWEGRLRAFKDKIEEVFAKVYIKGKN